MQNGSLSVDHIFMLVEHAEAERTIETLRRRGLTPSSGRSHGRLGTSNRFFCFDNAFLEILWISNRTHAAESPLAQQLMERVELRRNGANPFGIGLRTASRCDPLPFETWIYHPPGDAGLVNDIAIATSSADPTLPLLFRAQRTKRPDEWVDGAAGERQRPGGYSDIVSLRLCTGTRADPSGDLSTLSRLGMLSLRHAANDQPDIEVGIATMQGAATRALSLARLDWIA
jgi:Glyoxalase-like domain